MSDNIPFDIQVEILKRFPVKSLIQFRSVTKAWKSLIDSSNFIARYSDQRQHLLVRYIDEVDKEEKYVSIVDDDTFPQQRMSPTPPMLVNMIKYSSIFGISHGLLCLRGEYEHGSGRLKSRTFMAVLWNISIKKAIGVVVPESGMHTTLGFWVCRETTDPKIVKITCINGWWDMENINVIPRQVEVFTLSTGAWRSPHGNNLPRKSIQFERFQVVIDEFIYWLAMDIINLDGRVEFKNMIISFDVTREEFTEVNLPDNLSVRQLSELSMSTLRESLVVLERDRKANNRVFHVWVMEDGVPNPFRKLYTIDTPYARIRRVLEFRKSGEPVIEFEQHGVDRISVLGYEPYSKCNNKFGIKGMAYSFQVYPYIKTLLLLDQPNFIIYDKGERYIENSKWIADAGPSIEDRALMFLETQDRASRKQA